jgi:hypothetical protein
MVILFVKLYCPREILQSTKDYLSLAADLMNHQLLRVGHIRAPHTGLIAAAMCSRTRFTQVIELVMTPSRSICLIFATGSIASGFPTIFLYFTSESRQNSSGLSRKVLSIIAEYRKDSE